MEFGSDHLGQTPLTTLVQLESKSHHKTVHTPVSAELFVSTTDSVAKEAQNSSTSKANEVKSTMHNWKRMCATNFESESVGGPITTENIEKSAHALESA